MKLNSACKIFLSTNQRIKKNFKKKWEKVLEGNKKGYTFALAFQGKHHRERREGRRREIFEEIDRDSKRNTRERVPVITGDHQFRVINEGRGLGEETKTKELFIQ
ncbi:MAG: hypothetical protein IJJ77_01680, partial [Paludibacteraceae bacterium]|nr:hypothetical protein [Paludibacteraceae bacterium]